MSVATLPPAQDQSEDQPSHEGWPQWLVPPDNGFFSEDLDRLPELPRRTELHNGSLVFVSPQARWHRRVITKLFNTLEATLPEGWRAEREMAVRLDKRNQREPDVCVVTAESYDGDERGTWYAAEDVLVAIEVVSPESRLRDTVEKPSEYAKAGIRFFWLVEKEGSAAVVHVYELDLLNHKYKLVDIYRDRLVLAVPFETDIPLTSFQ